MYQVIARKYRPQTFAELVGQEHVRTTLENAIAQSRIAHGYIFSGQRGTGKTTVARILARCLNCVKGPTATPCGECASCLEIAARQRAGRHRDRRGLQSRHQRDARAARERPLPPGARPLQGLHRRRSAPDHQRGLQRAAEDAGGAARVGGLHPLHHRIAQDPDDHRLALPAVQLPLGGFRRAGRRAWQWICEQEGIKADAEALAVLAQAGEGSVRDSLSALDQAIACCGDEAARPRRCASCSGVFSLDSLDEVAERAGRARLAGAMLEIVAELEAQRPATCSTSAASWRATSAICWWPGSPAQDDAADRGLACRAGQPARDRRRAFSEEDLTRYLQLTLEIYPAICSTRLQPRLHLEMGLLRLVHAGRIKPIEDALRDLGGPVAPPAAKAASTARTPPPRLRRHREAPPPLPAPKRLARTGSAVRRPAARPRPPHRLPFPRAASRSV